MDLFEAILTRAFLDAKLNVREETDEEQENTDENQVKKRSRDAWAEATAKANRDASRAWLLGEEGDGKLDWRPRNLEETDPHLIPFTADEGNDWFEYVCHAAGRNPDAVRERAVELSGENWEFGYTESSSSGDETMQTIFVTGKTSGV